MSQARSDAAEFVASHPKLLGALFTALLALSQAGAAAGAAKSTIAGP